MSTASVAAAVAGMRVVGVIDLKDGTAVHAVRGERERYRPVHSVIGGDDGDPLALARGFRESSGSTSSTSPTSTRSSGSGEQRMPRSARWRARRASWSTRASASRTRAQALLDLGAQRVIVGTETLAARRARPAARASCRRRLVLSVDLRDGRVLSPDAAARAAWRARRAGAPAPRRPARGDRARPRARGQRRGAGRRADRRAPRGLPRPRRCSRAAACATPTDLRALDAAGAAGALVATALHRGVIGAQELAALR